MTTLDLITREDLQKFKAELFAELRSILPATADTAASRKWLRSAEVRKILNISPGTLQNLRNSGQLRFSKVGSMTYYKSEDITTLLEDNVS
ncbi:helix-turn-helix domain-containing protein [Pedobacter psychroterrae]|uniref:DNA-binding protein n=1 Tax=Pedobacter psychroterrae TaxID=2530453 RepID=A0A4R0NL78_9SPHI|nr:helix-turn-helix domain-containing protein [Pedobacter psychroterrae]TCD01376.1 DNA-binding protein [Pedobacter psychroterrae]